MFPFSGLNVDDNEKYLIQGSNKALKIEAPSSLLLPCFILLSLLLSLYLMLTLKTHLKITIKKN